MFLSLHLISLILTIIIIHLINKDTTSRNNQDIICRLISKDSTSLILNNNLLDKIKDLMDFHNKITTHLDKIIIFLPLLPIHQAIQMIYPLLLHITQLSSKIKLILAILIYNQNNQNKVTTNPNKMIKMKL